MIKINQRHLKNRIFLSVVLCVVVFISCSQNPKKQNDFKELESVLYRANIIIRSDIERRDMMAINMQSVYDKSEREKMSSKLYELVRKFDAEMKDYKGLKLNCNDLAELEKNYLLEIPKALSLGSIQQMDDLIIGDLKQLLDDFSFPIDKSGCGDLILSKETLELEKLKYKIVISYSLNYLFP